MTKRAVLNVIKGTGWAVRTPLASVALIVALTPAAQAQTEFSQKAAAEAVFHEAAKLLQEGQIEQACGKFEASHQLDPAVGTVLRLADCYDRAGKTASAWATFQEAAAMAQTQGQSERVQIARERAADLQARLSHVTINLAAANRDIAGLKVMLNESEIPGAVLGTAIPVNPGVQRVQVQASGYDAWSKQITVEGTPSNTDVAVPELERGIVTQMPTSPPPVVGVQASAQTPANQNMQGTASQDTSAPQMSGPHPAMLEDRGTGNGQRLLGYISGAAGIGALAVGGYFAYRAYDLNNQSLDHCLSGEPNACTERGTQVRQDARDSGNMATIVGGAGLAVVGASFVILLTAPSERERPMSVQLSAGADGAGLELEGVW